MRILHILQRYWPAVGGAESYAQELSRRLASEGHDVTVATTDALGIEGLWDARGPHVAGQREEHEGVRILRFPVRHLPASRVSYAATRRLLLLLSRTTPAPSVWLGQLSRLTPWVPGLWHWLATTPEPFDLVAAMTICFEPLLEAGLRYAQSKGIPFVAHPLTHLGAGPKPGEDPISRYYTMRHQVALVRASSAVIAQTEAERAFYSARGVAPERITVVGQGIEPERVCGGDGGRFRQQHGLRGVLVSSLGAMSYDKGTVHLVEAMRALWRNGRREELVLAGSVLSPFAAYLAGLPAEVRGRIRLLGPVSEEEKRDLLAATDILALPSRSDSFGIVYLEAWANRRPVIGARSWGISDVIDDPGDGLLVPFGDVPALAEAIGCLASDAALRAAMGSRGEQKLYRLHTWHRKYALIRTVYEGLAPKAG